MENDQMQQIRRLVDVALRRKALILFCTLLGVSLGLAYYLTQPKIFQSTALLSYQQQRINPSEMSPDVVSRIQETVNTTTQIILSRSSLEKIIADLGLFKESENPPSVEAQVQALRQNINVQRSSRDDTFSISFSGRNPSQVALVTNSLAARFIEENLQYREERAQETSLYTQDELNMAKEMLDQLEAKMRDYKLAHFNEMPEQREGNLTRLNSLQEQYQGRQDSIQDLERTRVMLQEQINVRRQLLAENARLRQNQLQPQTPVTAQPETQQERLARLQTTLQQLLGRYTERHPEVKQIRREISSLEQSIEQNLGEAADSTASASQRQPSGGRQFDQELFDLQIQLKDIGLNIEELNKERVELKAAIEQYEQWIAAVPEREAEWSALTREYAELRRHYDELVSQNLQAQSSLNLERKQKGSQFRIEDSARVPEKPVSPVFVKIMALALLAGAGVGGVLAFGLNMLDTSLRSPADFENLFQQEVICSIPYLPLKRETRREHLWSIAGALFFVVYGAAIVAVIFYTWKQGHIIV
ncbi:polysaccharide chain length determinant protein, PEP-CTERM locus subfamily [Desulfofustis glycolicus DSM 9705]|uniref:Polysaccharide chain length determinant protein, PEP-CTERM locus subfamily n=2 Tax=Desulfofustis glycolicus TaxID=51195 RepID=A0A1M5YLB3_9BACT|nr:polysaccharide chain length determinant protein, PEP-CTERM locus subfamily [Desulfofustis glycolicus DSM 9705]